MPRKAKPKPKVPWYKRWKALIIGAGALAVAILGVINLWDRIFPPPDEDIARIESINIIKRTALTGFAAGGIGKDLPLTPVPDKAGISGLSLITDPRARAEQRPAAPATPVLPTRQLFTDFPLFTVAPPSPAETTPTPGPSPTVTTATASPTPTLTTPPASPSPSSGSATPTESPTPTDSPTFLGVSPEMLSALSSISDEYIFSVTQQAPMQGFPRQASMFVARSLIIQAVDDKGEPLPPAEVAEELAQALEEVEATSGPEGEDPQGWTIAVRVDLEGLANIPLLLTWSLDGLDVPHTWQAENLAYRVVGATPHDAGVAEIWVPDLKRPGSYNVNIKLSYESSGLVADWRPLELPDTGVIQGGG